MSKRPFVIFGIFAAICVLLIPFVALNKEGGQEASPKAVPAADADSKALFVTNCGPCHTLARAGTDGVVGPNLDELLSISTPDGNYPRVLAAVEKGIGGRMPAGILTGDEAKEVAKFVADYVDYVNTGP